METTILTTAKGLRLYCESHAPDEITRNHAASIHVRPGQCCQLTGTLWVSRDLDDRAPIPALRYWHLMRVAPPIIAE